MAVGEFDAAFPSQSGLPLAENFWDGQGLLVCQLVLGVGKVSMVRDEFIDGHRLWRRCRGKSEWAFVFCISALAVEFPSFRESQEM